MKEKSSHLKREAEAILKDLSLLELVGQFGVARLVGSTALDLLVKRDIDIHLLVKDSNLMDVVDRIYHELLGWHNIKELRISDYREREGVKIGIDSYHGPSGVWDLDIWVTNRAERTGFAIVERLRGELLPEHRKVIMKIKRAYHKRGELRDGLSTLIYEAVLDAGVRNLDEFREFLSVRTPAVRKELTTKEQI